MFKNRNPLNLLLWLLVGILFLGLIYLLVLLFPFYKVLFGFILKIIGPFIVAAIIAYILEPVIKKLTDQHVHLGLSILIVYIVFFGSTGILIYNLYPMMLEQMQELSKQLPSFLKQYKDLVYQLYVSTSFLPEAVHDQMDALFEKAEVYGEQLLGKWVGNLTGIFDVVIFLAIIPVLVFYFLKDYQVIRVFSKKCINRKYHERIRVICIAVDESLGNYIRGQMIVCLFVAIASWGVFSLIGLKYAAFLGVLMGITNLIPYFGPLIGLVPALLIAISVSGKLVLYVIIACLVIQIVESNLLSPFIMGKSIRIHPIAILFALLIGGELGGIIGMIVAVPILTILHNSYIRLHYLQHKR